MWKGPFGLLPAQKRKSEVLHALREVPGEYEARNATAVHLVFSEMKDQEPVLSVTIADCRVEALASTGGNGGQNRNRRHTAIRITHPPSKAVGFSKDERSQLQNKVLAWRRMAQSEVFQRWAKLETLRRVRKQPEQTLDEVVDEAMRPEHILVECRDDAGDWVKSE